MCQSYFTVSESSYLFNARPSPFFSKTRFLAARLGLSKRLQIAGLTWKEHIIRIIILAYPGIAFFGANEVILSHSKIFGFIQI